MIGSKPMMHEFSYMGFDNFWKPQDIVFKLELFFLILNVAIKACSTNWLSCFLFFQLIFFYSIKYYFLQQFFIENPYNKICVTKLTFINYIKIHTKLMQFHGCRKYYTFALFLYQNKTITSIVLHALKQKNLHAKTK